jgi:hypothetical protein
MLHLSCVTPATTATSAPASRRGLHRARLPAPRQARNSRVSCCANAAPPFCWSHCVCRIHADSEPRFARAHSGVAGWQRSKGGAGRCTVACSACSAGDHAGAAAPSCASPRASLHAPLCYACACGTCAPFAATRCFYVLTLFVQRPLRGGVASWPFWQYQVKLMSLVPMLVVAYVAAAAASAATHASWRCWRAMAMGGHACPDEGTG